MLCCICEINTATNSPISVYNELPVGWVRLMRAKVLVELEDATERRLKIGRSWWLGSNDPARLRKLLATSSRGAGIIKRTRGIIFLSPLAWQSRHFFACSGVTAGALYCSGRIIFYLDFLIIFWEMNSMNFFFKSDLFLVASDRSTWLMPHEAGTCHLMMCYHISISHANWTGVT
jgi:hypothetical protein